MKALVCIFMGWLAVSSVATAANAPDILRWRRYEEPIFPPELHDTVVRDGFATVVFTFDDDGRITDRIVLVASHPAFTAAVLHAMRGWEVDTAGLARSLRRETLRFDFVRRGSVISLSQRDASKTALSPYGDHNATALATCHEEQIDTPLKVTTNVTPTFPPALKSAGVEGMATISFVVDGEGRVRVPIVADASHSEFGAVALEAMRQWRFAPARRNGQRVQVIAERTILFRPRTNSK